MEIHVPRPWIVVFILKSFPSFISHIQFIIKSCQFDVGNMPGHWPVLNTFTTASLLEATTSAWVRLITFLDWWQSYCQYNYESSHSTWKSDHVSPLQNYLVFLSDWELSTSNVPKPLHGGDLVSPSLFPSMPPPPHCTSTTGVSCFLTCTPVVAWGLASCCSLILACHLQAPSWLAPLLPSPLGFCLITPIFLRLFLLLYIK